MISLQDVQAAAAVLEGHIVATPCLHSLTVSEVVGTDVWIKFENLQFTGSFKERGALVKLASLSEEQRRRA